MRGRHAPTVRQIRDALREPSTRVAVHQVWRRGRARRTSQKATINDRRTSTRRALPLEENPTGCVLAVEFHTLRRLLGRRNSHTAIEARRHGHGVASGIHDEIVRRVFASRRGPAGWSDDVPELHRDRYAGKRVRRRSRYGNADPEVRSGARGHSLARLLRICSRCRQDFVPRHHALLHVIVQVAMK